MAEPSPHPPIPLDLPILDVLVAEDNPINQKVIDAMLRRQGWKVVLAANGKEAFERFQERPFHLILMDIQMPEIDGLQAARLIRLEEHRKSRDSCRTPVIALTAHASEAQHGQYLREGFDAVLTKPITLPSLLGEIRKVLGWKSTP